jgi:hypothetical protein
VNVIVTAQMKRQIKREKKDAIARSLVRSNVASGWVELRKKSTQERTENREKFSTAYHT